MKDAEEEDNNDQIRLDVEERETNRDHDDRDRADFATGSDGQIKDKQHETSAPSDHVIYEEKSVLKRIQLEYVKSADSLEKVDEYFVDPQGVVESTLYCECGDVFEKWENAVEHIQEFRS